MLANNKLIEYLCDPGADETIISRATYDKINTPEYPVLLHTYKGGPIASCNEKIPQKPTASELASNKEISTREIASRQ